jgi:hypothetical protein
MKSATLLIALCAVSITATAQNYVKPHVRKDGTYVQGHYRSDTNSTDRDNWSTRGNSNPYTGQQGTRTPKQDILECGYTSTGRYVCR